MSKVVENIKKSVLKDGRPRWTARVKVGCSEIQKTFSDERAAVQWKLSMELDKSKARLVASDLHSTRFEDIFQWAKSDPNLALPASTAHNLPRLTQILGKLTAGATTQQVLNEHISRLRASKKRGGGAITPDTFRRAYYALRVVLNAWAAHHSYVFPFQLNHKLPAPWRNVRNGRISDEDIQRLKAAVPNAVGTRIQVWPLVFDFLLNTGLRRKELVNATWQDVRSGVLVLYAEQTKTRVDRYVTLNAAALEVLDRLPRESIRLFGFSSAQVMGRQFSQIAHAAGLPHITAHCFRHEFTSRIVEQTNYSHAQIMELTGHRTFSTYRRYYNLRPDCALHGFNQVRLSAAT